MKVYDRFHLSLRLCTGVLFSILITCFVLSGCADPTDLKGQNTDSFPAAGQTSEKVIAEKGVYKN